MRVLGLDIGERRIGVAISDPSGRVATPVAILDAEAVTRDPQTLRAAIEDRDIDRIVAGLPLTLAGEEGAQAVRVRDVADRIGAALGVPVDYSDERLSSAEVERVMGAAGAGARARRGRVDASAAAWFLQGYLDAMNRRTGTDE